MRSVGVRGLAPLKGKAVKADSEGTFFCDWIPAGGKIFVGVEAASVFLSRHRDLGLDQELARLSSSIPAELEGPLGSIDTE